MKKVLANTIRNEVAAKGGTSIMTADKLVTIVDGERKEQKVLLEHGSEYVFIEE